MKRSTERILTTHVGSLARPDALVPILKAKDCWQPYDRGADARLITDGEQGKASTTRGRAH